MKLVGSAAGFVGECRHTSTKLPMIGTQSCAVCPAKALPVPASSISTTSEPLACTSTFTCAPPTPLPKCPKEALDERIADSVQMATVWLTCRVVAPAVGMVMGLVRTCAEAAPVPF